MPKFTQRVTSVFAWLDLSTTSDITNLNEQKATAMQNSTSSSLLKIALATALVPFLTSCGGGGDSAAPSDPDSSSCSVSGQKDYFLSYMRDNYFWYQDIPSNVNTSNYSNVYDLLDGIRSPQDRFSFILTEEEYQQRYVNAEYIGFGFSTRVEGSRLYLNYVYEDSPAANAGMTRGTEILAVDGTSVASLIANNSLNDAFGAAESGVTRTLTWRSPTQAERDSVVSKEAVETNTVLTTQSFAHEGKAVGYYVLNSFINRTGDDLNSAYNALAGVDELVIDVRYNGGGLIRYAVQAATQAAGDNVLGYTAAKLLYNDKNTDKNSTYLFELGEGIQQLNLDRVFVLTTGASCSSSEMLINSLTPFVDVVVIGKPTCGKPVGQSPQPFCDKISYAINFETVNANNEGRYFDGLPVTCNADDSIVGDWGVNGDPLLDEAKHYMSFGTCSPQAVATAQHAQSETIKPAPPMSLPEQWKREF